MDYPTPQVATTDAAISTEARPVRAETKRRRGRGEASISQRQDGRWLIQVSGGVDAAGRRIRRSLVADTKAEAIAKLDALRGQQRATGTLPAASKLRVTEFLDQWLESKRASVARRTYQCYADLARIQVKPTPLGGSVLQRVTPLDIQGWLLERERAGISAASRANARRMLCTAFESAVDLGLLPTNPVRRVKAPRVVVEERRWISREEALRILAAADAHPAAVRAFAWALLGSGARIGEVLGLAWRDVNLAAGRITIRQAVKCVGAEVFVEKPKSKAAERTITLPAGAIAALKALRGSATPLGDVLVFRARTGQPWRASNVHRRVWVPLLQLAQVEPCGFHAARRGHISELLEAGANLKSVSVRVGHATTQLTADTYAQVVDGADRKLADLTDQLLASKAGVGA